LEERREILAEVVESVRAIFAMTRRAAIAAEAFENVAPFLFQV
jgi:hypothetical protein